MKIVVDPNIPFAQEAFGSLGDLVLAPGRQINAATVRDADALLVRSVTLVNATLLDGSQVKFVATATIGTDHVDEACLRERGIGFASAAGSNANSVAEYVVAALLELAHRQGFRLSERTLGVVGVGHVGSRVIRYAESLGMRVLPNDPPRERAAGRSDPSVTDTGGRLAQPSPPDFVSLDRILAEADIITLHVPLTRTGVDATFHLFDKERLAALEDRHPILVNTARGAVVDNKALLQAVDGERVRGTVLDVWENEPDISPELLEVVDIGTPHIAGYSFDGKVNGTQMIHRAVCQFFGVPSTWQPPLPPPEVPRIELSVSSGDEDDDVVRRVVRRVYDITVDDAALRRGVRAPEGIAAGFDTLRAVYPIRREFFNTELVLRGASDILRKKFAMLGFKLV